jgi:Collagen triple helix repeat (20 copies)
LRKLVTGALVTAAVLAAAAIAIGQITNGVPSPQPRGNLLASPPTLLAGGWDQKILATGAQNLENPVGIFKQYGYLSDNGAAPPNCANYVAQTSGLKTKTEPDQNTYVVTGSNPGGPAAGYDYGRHFLIQGHELFSNAGNGVGQTNSAYLTRINLDVPTYDPHRITLLGFTAGADNCNTGMASLDGSTYDPFTGQMLFTGEAGGNANYGGVYATPLNWSSTTAPAVQHSSLQGIFGYGGYEGIQVDDKGSLYIAEDAGGSTVSNTVKKANSFIYRFVPTDPADLSAGGELQALRVSVDGTPLTFASQDPVAGAPDKRLYSGETLQASWVTIHDTGTDGTTPFDANAAAKAANATPFKRPENGRFVPASGFKSYAFTVTGDTNATAIANQTPDGQTWADRGAAGAVMQLDMPSSGSNTGTVRAIVPGDFEHNSYDSITFLDKHTLLVGEDRGETLHTQLNALDSTHSFDLTQPFSQRLATAQRLIAQGRDPEATEDIQRKEGSPPQADQNDGDNEVTGLLVSNGESTVAKPFGAEDPAEQSGTRAFYTGQHGANITYELLPPGPLSSRTSPGVQGPAGEDGQNGRDGEDGHDGAAGPQGPTGPGGPTGATGGQGPTGPQGATGRAGRDGVTILCSLSGKKVSCKQAKSSRLSSATAASVVRGRVTYAKGTLRSMRTVRKIKRGVRYKLVIGKGRASWHMTVKFH